MKTVTTSLLITIMCLSMQAQSKYETAMQSALESFGKAQTIEELQQTAARFEQISEVEKEAWLPAYYAGMVYCITSYRTSNTEEKSKLISKAQTIVDALLLKANDESEVHTLQGMVYQAGIMLDPQKFGQSYSAKANGAFQTAIKLNPANPRPYYLKALSVLNTPEQFGGGKKAAQPLLEEAMQRFNDFET